MNTKIMTRTGVLLALCLAVQFLHLPIYITGPAVNAVLFTAAALSGTLSGIFIGCITPLAALLLGIVHPITMPLVPVIMTANAALVLVFGLLRSKNIYIAVLVSALVKYFVFYISLNYIIALLGIKIPPPLLAAFQAPQLLTALIGGGLGVAVIKYLESTFQIQ